MRRLILIIAAALMLVLLATATTGCGGDGDTGKRTETGKDTSTQSPDGPTPEGDIDDAPDITLPDESPDIATPEESPVPGFELANTMVDEGFISSEYVGTGTAAEALELFYTWAEGEGWVLLQEGFSDIPEDPGMDAQGVLLGGRLYEKGDETMSITAMQEGGEVHVFVDIASAQAL